MGKRTIYFLIIIIFILLAYNFAVFSTTINVKVREYLEGKFPAIFTIYLASLEELDDDEIEFIDLLEELPEHEQRAYVRQVYEKGFSLEILDKLKRWQEKLEKPYLNVAFPSQTEITIWNSPLYIFGTTDASSDVRVTVNDKEVQLHDYRTGNFLTLVEMPEGERLPIIVTASRGKEKVSIEKTVFYPRAWEDFPTSPLTIHSTRMQPEKDQVLKIGDELRVMFQGSPGAEATFQIGDNPHKVLMEELNDSNLPLEGRGIYMGSYIIQEQDVSSSQGTMLQTITVTLRIGDKEISRELPGKISFFSKLPIKLVEVVDEKARIHQVNEDSFVFQGSTLGGDGLPTQALGYYLLPGTLFEVTGIAGEYLRVNLGAGKYLIHKDNVREIKNITKNPFSELSKIGLNETNDKLILRFNTRERIPFLIKDESQQLSLVLYGVKSSDYVEYEGEAPSLQKIKIEPLREEAPDAVEITIEPYQSIVGFDYQWDKTELVISIQKPPDISKHNPLQGRTIIVDAGHGGRDPGAIGPGNIHEKDVVLEISKILGSMLEDRGRGAKVIMTRNEDVYIDISERIDSGIRHNTDLFISIHANAHAVGADAVNYHGHMTIYNYDYNQSLAETIMDNLVKRIGLPRTRVWKRRDLAILKRPQFPSVLVETAFMMHPDDNWYLLQPDYQKEFAAAIMDGIIDYFFSLQYEGNPGI
jgi:N-acetylmuramoyl-L-alanine amidase